jgi:hypothetical protein
MHSTMHGLFEAGFLERAMRNRIVQPWAWERTQGSHQWFHKGHFVMRHHHLSFILQLAMLCVVVWRSEEGALCTLCGIEVQGFTDHLLRFVMHLWLRAHFSLALCPACVWHLECVLQEGQFVNAILSLQTPFSTSDWRLPAS